MKISTGLEGKLVLVCGISRGGIGGATARLLASEGANIVAVDHDQRLIDETIADVEGLGGQCLGIRTNLMDPAETDGLIPAIFHKFGRLDAIANVAGGTRAEEFLPLEETPLEMFRQTVNLNFEYVFRICRDAAAEMIRRKTPGAIVNVSSISSLAAAPYHGPYGAAKSGIVALTRTMAFEWSRYGIRANSVLPGAVWSDRTKSRQKPGGPTPAELDLIYTSIDQLASVILFLLSDMASGVTGQALTVDSGLSTKFCAGGRKLVA